MNDNDKDRKEYQREWARRKRAEKKEAQKSQRTVDAAVVVDGGVDEEWDKEEYPVKEAWEIAVVRADRARKYAAMFPHLIGPSDREFQTVAWQYAFEGLPAVEKRGHAA